MKLVIDLQSMQGESRHRGIGRYTAGVSRAFVEIARDKHEIWIAVNAQLGHVEHIRAMFDDLLPQDRIVAFSTAGSAMSIQPENDWRTAASEIIREDFLRGLDPDLVWIPSLFEGWIDDSVTSIGTLPSRALHALVVYDLIPLANSLYHLADSRIRSWYYRKLAHLKRADILLAISDYTREEVTSLLDIPADRVANISCASSDLFRRTDVAPNEWDALRRKLGLEHPFVLYVGGYDGRKNVGHLIRAYAKLPSEIRRKHCLVLGGRIVDSERIEMQKVAREHGLANAEMVFTGQIDDKDLVALYNRCELFVFPSLQEGFGLPVLEAMACAAPVLAARATSLPEVVGRDDMLFDPENPGELSRQMADILCSPELKADLSSYGQRQAQNFSWRHSAQCALDAFERLADTKRTPNNSSSFDNKYKRPRLAYVSPLPPERTGIADYSAELLVDLGTYYEIDVIVEQSVVTDDWVTSNYAIRDAAWFDENAWRFDRILYQFGNSSFHLYQLPLLRKHPGTVVLHDSFIGAFSAWRASNAGDPDAYLRRLYQSHGYAALLKDTSEGRSFTIAEFPSSLEIIRDANGVVVHSQYAIDRAAHFYGDAVTSTMRRIAFPKKPRPINRAAARTMLGLARDEFVVCSFGMIAPTKLNQRLLSAWLDSILASDKHCRLVFVGENHAGDYGQALVARIKRDPAGRRIRITGFAEPAEYRAWIEAADLAVQLRTESRGETSAAVFDCMAQGLPLIVNAHATFAELDPSTVFVLPDQFTHQQLIDLLHHAYESVEIRQKLGKQARSAVQTSHHPDVVARQYRDAIEHFAINGRMARECGVADALARLPVAEESDLLLATQALSRNYPALRQRQILVDVTATARNDLKTGIERVTRNIVREWIGGAIEGLRVEPVRFHNGHYVYAREFTSRLLGIENPGLTDEIVEVSAGDIFFGLDWVADIVPSQVALFQSWRDRSVGIYFTVYDLLPVLKPKAFPPGIEDMCATWLRSIASCADGLSCISKAVANELIVWLDAQQVARARPLAIGYYHLGAELDGRINNEELSQSTQELLKRLTQEPTVLMVGTVEPRKGHTAVLDAFDLLWQRGSGLHLAIVGKQGWMTDELAARIRKHPEFGRHLHWPSGVSDGELDCLYEAADVLLAASEGEGFGLPLIEAARRQLPVIARDIPVFREVAGSSALYFAGESADEIARVIDSWFLLNEGGKVPPSKGINWLSWKESAVILGRMAKDREHLNWLYAWQSAGKIAASADVCSVISASSVDTPTDTIV